MKAIPIRSWREFTDKIAELQNKFSFVPFAGQKWPQTVLFRGQADADNWRLNTTLERYSSSSTWSALSYQEMVYRCVHAIESVTGDDWKLLPFSEVKHRIQSDDNKHSLALPNLEFCVYLRQNGFPSPLLDWTVSPYVAAFFAFAEPVTAGDAAVFTYVGNDLGKAPEERSITMQRPYVSTHKRHLLQQARYTVCTRFDSGDHVFTSHEEAFKADENQDALLKIIIPRSNRVEFLKHLDTMNINHFSLFQSDESLVKTIAFREIDMQNA